ncbi:putative ribonuclease H-like domain-containing protein [Tanacetum coccineum]
MDVKMAFLNGILREEVYVSQPDGFTDQDNSNHVYKLKKDLNYGIEISDVVDTPMVEKSKLDEDPQGKAVDLTCYSGMIGSLMYLTSTRPNLGSLMYLKSSRPDLVFVVCSLKNKGIVDSRCSKHMTGNKAHLAEYQDYNGCPVVLELDENQVLLRVPIQNNMYSFNLENIVPSGGLACLIAKATVDESNKCHRRLGHVNFKNLNKLVKGNLVRGLPSKIFQNDHTCVACQKGKQHKASCKAKSVSSISQSLQLLHMDLFGPTSVRSLNHKTYCLVITDDFCRFS